MYVTRRLSWYHRDPTALSLPPPEGPNSGILVIQDEEAQPTCCFGLCHSDRVENLPFPQNYNLRVEYVKRSGAHRPHGQQHRHVSIDRVIFIPVLNQPLSSHQYYCISREGKHTGKAYKSSTEEDMTTCCFCKIITDFKPESLDPQDVYQQFEIRPRSSYGFVAKSVTPDGFPPHFLRRKGWKVSYSTSTPTQISELSEAQGLDSSLRARLPVTDFPVSEKASPAAIVGKWYCPFIFIKDRTLKDQMNSSRFYEVTLEQRWEQIFGCDNNGTQGDSIYVDVALETESIEPFGKAAVMNREDGMVWFTSVDKAGVGESGVGLNTVVVERMKWEESRFGWTSEREVRVKTKEKFGGESNEWKKFGCYVLVERFVLKRMNGSVVLTYDFKHPQHIISKWE